MFTGNPGSVRDDGSSRGVSTGYVKQVEGL